MYDGVVYNKKDGSGLGLTRSFGDLCAHENNVITEIPEITTFQVQQGDILIFASDGLWDVMSNEEVMDFVQENAIVNGRVISQGVQNLVTKARKIGSRDDISVLVVIIK